MLKFLSQSLLGSRQGSRSKSPASHAAKLKLKAEAQPVGMPCTAAEAHLNFKGRNSNPWCG